MIACECAVCQSSDPRNRRLRSSVRFIVDGKNFLIDTTPDLRQQCLTYGLKQLEAVLLTHPHADHILGMEELRAFFYQTQKPTDIYLSPKTLAELKKVFHYVFEPSPDYKGTLPQLNLKTFNAGESLQISGVTFKTFAIKHGAMEVCGFRLGDLSYATDVDGLPEAAQNTIKGSRVLILGAIGETPRAAHFSIDQAIAAAEKIGVEELYLTHLGHSVDYSSISAKLPDWVKLCYDGLRLSINL